MGCRYRPEAISCRELLEGCPRNSPERPVKVVAMSRSVRVVGGAAAAVALAVLAAVVGFAAGAGQDEDEPTGLAIADGRPHLVSSQELEELGPLLGTIYWAGERNETALELTVLPSTITIRYLPAGATVGAKTEVLTVATYRDVVGYEALEDLGDNATLSQATSGAIIAVPHANPESAYFAFPSGAFQVEVYSPEDGQALELVKLGQVRLVADEP